MLRPMTVYGFTTLEGATRLEARKPKVDGIPLRPVSAAGVAAIIGPRPFGWIWEGEGRRTLRRLRTYQLVLESLMAFLPILPAKFETLFGSPRQLKGMLSACGGELREPVSQYGPLIQFEVLVTWSVIEAIDGLRSSGVIGRKFAADPERDAHAALALRDAVEGHRRALTARIRTILSGVSLDVIETARMEETIVANFTVLLRRADELALDAALQALDRETGGSLRIRCIGPLPPCSFAAVEVNHADPNSVRKACHDLQIGETVSPDDLKAAYREAVRRIEPATDPTHAPATSEMVRLRDAYALLSRVAAGQLHHGLTRNQPAQPMDVDADGAQDQDGISLARFDRASVRRTFSVRLRRDGDHGRLAA